MFAKGVAVNLSNDIFDYTVALINKKPENVRTADTALRLSKYFGNSADFWMGIQDEFDLREEIQRIGTELNRIPKAATLNYLLQ